jgi:hypothetical protein
LRAGRKDVLDRARIFLGVVAVGSCGSTQDRRKERGVAESVRVSAGNRQNALAAEEVLGVGSKPAGALEDENIVPLGSRNGIVVEMVDRDGGTVGGKVEVEFEEKRADSAGGCGLSGESEEDVAVAVDEVDKVLGA